MTAGIIMLVLGLVLFMLIPVIGLFIGGPLALIGILMMACGGKKCAVCGGSRLLDKAPEASDENRTKDVASA